MSARVILSVVVLGAVATTGIAARSATGNPGRTLTFRVSQPAARDQRQVDLPPKGPSLGDESLVAARLRKNRHLFGRPLTVCVLNDASFRGEQCSTSLVLRNGVITAHGAGLER